MLGVGINGKDLDLRPKDSRFKSPQSFINIQYINLKNHQKKKNLNLVEPNNEPHNSIFQIVQFAFASCFIPS